MIVALMCAMMSWKEVTPEKFHVLPLALMRHLASGPPRYSTEMVMGLRGSLATRGLECAPAARCPLGLAGPVIMTRFHSQVVDGKRMFDSSVL